MQVFEDFLLNFTFAIGRIKILYSFDTGHSVGGQIYRSRSGRVWSSNCRARSSPVLAHLWSSSWTVRIAVRRRWTPERWDRTVLQETVRSDGRSAGSVRRRARRVDQTVRSAAAVLWLVRQNGVRSRRIFSGFSAAAPAASHHNGSAWLRVESVIRIWSWSRASWTWPWQAPSPATNSLKIHFFAILYLSEILPPNRLEIEQKRSGLIL